MDDGSDENAAASPSVDVVELLVPVAGTEEEGKDGVLRCEEEYDRELCKCQETCEVNVSESPGRRSSRSHQLGWGCLGGAHAWLYTRSLGQDTRRSQPLRRQDEQSKRQVMLA